MSAPALSRPAPPLSVCDACEGEYQRQYEPLKFSGVHRDWLCTSCREALLEPSTASSSALSVAGAHTGAADDTNGFSCPR